MCDYNKTSKPSPDSKLTLAEVIRREPSVTDIIRQADVVRHWLEDEKLVCGNGLFQVYFKDWIASVVGWRREPDEVVDYYRHVGMANDLRTPSNWGVEAAIHGREAKEISQAAKTRAQADPVLDSGEAYELVHEAVYSRMPDCRKCGCLPQPAPEAFEPSGARYVAM